MDWPPEGWEKYHLHGNGSKRNSSWAAANGGVTNGGLRGVWPPFLEIGRNRPFSPFFCLFRPFPEGAKGTWKIWGYRRKKAFFLRYPQICLNPHLLNPHLRHSNPGILFCFRFRIQKSPRVRKIRVRNSGAGNGCDNFMDASKKCLFSAGKPMSIKFCVLGGGGLGGGGGKCRFYFYMGARIFLTYGKANEFPQIFFRICFRTDHVGQAQAITTGHTYNKNTESPQRCFLAFAFTIQQRENPESRDSSRPSKWTRRVWVANCCWPPGDPRRPLKSRLWVLWQHLATC